VKATGHTPGAEATCTTTQNCSVCSVELAPAKGHVEEVDKAVASTCTATGLTEGKHCSVCKAILVAQETVEKIAHTPENLPSVAPTCTGTGLALGSKCSVCGTILKAQDVVPATGHTMTTYWINGSSSGHWHECKVCKTKADFAAHTYTDGVCSICGYGCKHTGGTATCSELAVCTACKKPYGEMLAHTPGAAATCSTAQTCTVCNAVVTEKLDHELEFVDAKAATCGAAGWDKYEKCKNCDYTTYKEVAATGAHTYGDFTVVTEATTKAPGKQTHTCKTCNFVETVEIPVLDAPAIPWLWIIIAVVVVAAVIIVIVVVKKKEQ
jgi:hypothetical protein